MVGSTVHDPGVWTMPGRRRQGRDARPLHDRQPHASVIAPRRAGRYSIAAMKQRAVAYRLSWFVRLCAPLLLASPLAMAAPSAARLAAPQTAAKAAAPAGVALVLGNGTYVALPALPACLSSAHAVAATLRRLHFSVVEQEDGSLGVMEAALSRFTQQVRQAGRPPTVIYACGYGAYFNDHPFMLPVSAQVARPADVLTQAILTGSILATVAQSDAGPSLALLDVVPSPGSSSDLRLATLPLSGMPTQLGMLAVKEAPGGTLPTPAANGLIAALAGPAPVTVSGTLQALQNAMATQAAVTIAAVGLPVNAGDLIASTAAAMPSAASKPVAAAKSAVPAATTTSTADTAQPPMPGEDQMTAADRRDAQQALARLGYYDGKIDGIFGPDTRAAIRRWQFELHAPMTGVLTAPEASRLMRS